jgi:hypothetical protein
MSVGDSPIPYIKQKNILAQNDRERETRVIALQCAAKVCEKNAFYNPALSTIVIAKEFEKYINGNTI